MVINEKGDVGIGTQDPSALLHLYDNVFTNSAVPLRIETNNTANLCGVQFKDPSTTGTPSAIGCSGNDLIFTTNTLVGGNNFALTIKQQGPGGEPYFGFGDNNPQRKYVFATNRPSGSPGQASTIMALYNRNTDSDSQASKVISLRNDLSNSTFIETGAIGHSLYDICSNTVGHSSDLQFYNSVNGSLQEGLELNHNGYINSFYDICMNCKIIDDLSAINFCDGTYIGPGASFDISTNQHLKIYSNTTTFYQLPGTPSNTEVVDIQGRYSQLRLIDTDDDTFAHFSQSGGRLAIRTTSYTDIPVFTVRDNSSVGINTFSPSAALQVNSSATDSALTIINQTNITPDSQGIGHIRVQGNGYSSFFSLDGNGLNIGHNSSSRDIRFLINENPRVYINNDSSLRIASNLQRPDSNNVQATTILLGKSYIFSNSDFGVYKSSSTGKKIFFRYGTIPTTNTEIGSIEFDSISSVRYNTTSDGRLKTNLQSFDAKKILKDITSYKFTWKDTNQISYGVIAQDILQIPDISNIISGNTSGNLWSMDDISFNFLQIDYSRLVPILLGTNKQLVYDNENLTSNITILQTDNNLLRANIVSLQNNFDILRANITDLTARIQTLESP
jgi:hypothetical protein